MVISRADYISSIVFAILWVALLGFNIVVLLTGISSFWVLNALIGIWSAYNAFRFIRTIRNYREQVNTHG